MGGAPAKKATTARKEPRPTRDHRESEPEFDDEDGAEYEDQAHGGQLNDDSGDEQVIERSLVGSEAEPDEQNAEEEMENFTTQYREEVLENDD